MRPAPCSANGKGWDPSIRLYTTESGPDSHVDARHSCFFPFFFFLALRAVHLRDRAGTVRPISSKESQRLSCTAGRLIPSCSLQSQNLVHTLWPHRCVGDGTGCKAGGVCCNLSLTAPSLICSALFEKPSVHPPLTETPAKRLTPDWHLHIPSRRGATDDRGCL